MSAKKHCVSVGRYHALLWANLTHRVVNGSLDPETATVILHDRWDLKKPKKSLQLEFHQTDSEFQVEIQTGT